MNRKKVFRIILLLLRDFLILIAIGNVISIFTIPGDLWSVEVFFQNCMFSVAIGYPAWKGMVHISLVLEQKFPWLKQPIKRLVYQILTLFVFTGLIIFLGLSTWLMLTENIGFRAVLDLIAPSLKVVYIFMFLSLVLGNTVLFFKNWKEAAIQQEELKRAHLALQYQSLKDQVRPHFLFNSLSSLATLINTDADRATQFVNKLSDVYRYVLEQRENELVPLNEELKFLEDYIYLQKIRFGENLQVNHSLDLDQTRMVIPLSLQLLVENAIKHNEISGEHPLHIDILSTEQGHVIIKNNLRKKEVTEPSLGMGLENLRKQVDFFSEDSLLIQEEDGSFIVRVPTIPA
ncbi:MAG: sensor histidine kinase [Bacteroidales bacterium]|nr:sensor histidine kinase [Bacteroidales bacterium]